MPSSDSDKIFVRLTERYDLASSQNEFLHFDNPYQILIATILSAQTTDKTVNQVTQILFRQFPDPYALSHADPTRVEEIIHSTGFYRAKTRHIIAAAQTLVSTFHGEVPDTIAQLITIPGVGRKTANIVIHHGFGRADGIAVDTHVKRLSMRLGLSQKTDPDHIEQDLLKIFPKSIWGTINGLFILHGRKTCTAKKPSCNQCILSDLCPYQGKSTNPF